MSTASTSLKKKSHLPEFTVTALVITLFLIFIDEGNYSFSGLTDIGNILALGFYFLAMVVGQVLVFAVMERFLSEKLSLTWALILGTFLGAVGMALIFSWWMNEGQRLLF
ncbi:MAG: hypothetical protein U5L96_10705 [Owenweeksia sp.]|nr:hypothetical protein [Owenweeksia sp.]